jgi:hypothetical protein
LGTTFAHLSAKILTKAEARRTGKKLIKEIPEDLVGRVYTIVVENENTTGILLLITFGSFFLKALWENYEVLLLL